MMVGLDVDDVFTDTYPGIVQTAKSLYNIDITYQPRDFSILSRYLTESQMSKILDYCLCNPNIVQPNQECINLIKELTEKRIQDRFVFITRRPSFLEQKTRDFIGEYIPFVEWKVHFVPDNKTKVDYALEEGINVYIEDRYKYAKQLADAGVQVFLRRRPWNNFRGRNISNVYPFRNWEYVRYKLCLI